MKYIIPITILITIALCINIHISNNIEFNKAVNDWNACLEKQKYSRWDNYQEPQIGERIAETNKWCAYVFAIDKFIKE